MILGWGWFQPSFKKGKGLSDAWAPCQAPKFWVTMEKIANRHMNNKAKADPLHWFTSKLVLSEQWLLSRAGAAGVTGEETREGTQQPFLYISQQGGDAMLELRDVCSQQGGTKSQEKRQSRQVGLTRYPGQVELGKLLDASQETQHFVGPIKFRE